MQQLLKVKKTSNWIPREKFEDLYVRFMMFLDGIPYDTDYED